MSHVRRDVGAGLVPARQVSLERNANQSKRGGQDKPCPYDLTAYHN